MKPELLGFDPVTGAAYIRTPDGQVHTVAPQAAPEAMREVGAPAPFGPAPAPGLRDTTLAPTMPNAGRAALPTAPNTPAHPVPMFRRRGAPAPFGPAPAPHLRDTSLPGNTPPRRR